MFGKSKRPKDTMSVKDMTRLDKRPLKYVTMRDPETYKEVRLGENGAVNIMDGDFVLVCLGRDVMRCDLSEVRVGELMNLSGITVKGIDKEQVKKCRLSHTLRINSDATKQGLLFLPILQNDFCE